MSAPHSLGSKLLHLFQERETDPHLKTRCLIGFDGFIDEIISVVDKRIDPQNFYPLASIEEFGHKILEAKEKSGNIELVVKQIKMGGNAPLLTQALLEGGHRLFFAGAIGKKESVEPIFLPMAERCEQVLSLCPSAHTDALEFQDGKILLGKMGELPHICYETLMQQMPRQTWISLLSQTDLVATVNWTMLPHMTSLWKAWQKDLLPELPQRHDKPRWFFVDLADPSKRSQADLREALDTLKGFMPYAHVILGLNASEVKQAASVLKIPFSSSTKEEIQKGAQKIREKLHISHVVVHFARFAVAATEEGVFEAEGRYCSRPRLTTGAGDNFNAGYCHGLLSGLTSQEALQIGVALSGFYVREGRSPTVLELGEYLQNS